MFKRKCDPERVPVSCLSRHTPNTPLYKGDNYDCTEDCRNGNEGLDLPPTWFCFNCACGEDNDRNQQCPICAMKIKGDHKREPDKVYED